MLGSERLAFIQKKVDEAMIATDTYPDYRIDVEGMAEKLGFAVRRLAMNLPDIIGLMVINDMSDKMKRQTGSDKLIALNNKYDEPHLRFAIAHELGHFFLHKECVNGTNPVQFTQVKDDEKGIEEEACRFAAMLLMDKRKFQKAYDELKKDAGLINIDIIRNLAKKFTVPQRAVQRRIEELADER